MSEPPKDQYQMLAEEARQTLKLWDEGVINRIELLSMLRGAVARCREANWAEFKKPS